jgi:hypothetical protein
MVRVTNLSKERDFSLLQNVQTGSGAHSPFYSMGTGVLFPAGARGFSPPSIAEVTRLTNELHTAVLHEKLIVSVLIKKFFAF